VGIDTPIQVGAAQVTLTNAQSRNSYSVHYIMHYPAAGESFTALTAQIEGFDTPQAALAWGSANWQLTLGTRPLDFAYAHWELVGTEIEYQSGADFQYQYVFFYHTPVNVDYAQLSLQISDQAAIPLNGFWENSKQTKTSNDDHQLPIKLFATDSGGSQNTSSAYHTTVAGGHLNQAKVAYASVGGGRENMATNAYTTVGGGYANAASGRDATVGGGSRNIAGNYHATVAGGIRNQATASDATIGGGGYNLASDTYATVGGGTQNEARGSGAVVSGGAGNLAEANQATVGGGLGNQATGIYATIAGGQGNLARGGYSSIPGGFHNQALGEYSFATGQRAIVAVEHPGVFLFADSTAANFGSEQANEFGVRATGGVRLVTGVDPSGQPVSGVVLPPGSGSWSTLSDRGAKENFETVDHLQILAAVASLPIREWSYTSQNSDIRHVGPMSQDFYAAFGLGTDARHISSVDADGIALAAIQGLNQKITEQEIVIETLEARLVTIERRAQLGAVVLVVSVLGFWGRNSRYNRGPLRRDSLTRSLSLV